GAGGEGTSVFDDLDRVDELRGLLEYHRGGTVFLVRQPHSALDHVLFQPSSAHDEVEIDPGEHFRVFGGALSFQHHIAAAHVVPSPLQNQHHIVGGAAG